jgi:hypothetical protein
MNKKSIKRRFAYSGFIIIISISISLLMGSSHASGETEIHWNINKHTTWTPDGSPYVIFHDYGNIHVKRAYSNDNESYCPVLTITTEKSDGTHGDVVVKFMPQASLTFGSIESSITYNGALNAQGTEQHRIIFTANDPQNKWRGLRFSEATVSSKTILKNCTLTYGGNNYYSQKGTLHCYQKITLQNCTIQYSDTNGIYAENCSPVIDNCTISHSNDNGIYVKNGNLNIDNCTIRSNSENGIYAYACGSSVHGEIANSVITENEVYGIRLESCYSSYVCSPAIRYNEISQNATYGVYCNDERCNPEVTGNNFTQNGSYPLRILPFMRLSADNSFTGNGVQAIEVLGAEIFEDKTWHNFGVPYIIKGDNVWIPESKGKTCTLTIESGTTIKFDPGLGLELGGGGLYSQRWGILNAIGTKDSPITFTTSEPGQYWKGIKVTHTGSACRLDYCIVEYAGSEDWAGQPASNICFNGPKPGYSDIKNSTIRYSKGDGIFVYGPAGNGAIHNSNIYGNALYDIDSVSHININAELNFWGTPSGPSQDLCSSAVVGDSVTYEAWLEEEFTYPFRFASAGASPKEFNPITGQTEISFTLSEAADWTISILNRQFEKVWSTSGNGGSGQVVWNGMGDYGVVSGECFYRIEAENSSGRAAPAMGRLNLGNQTIAIISEPTSHSLFTAGTQVTIGGTTQTGTGGYYQVFYGAGEDPGSWTLIVGPIYSSKVNEPLATWDTTELDQPTYMIKLDVNNSGITYSDIVVVDFYIEDPLPDNASAIIYSYDSLGRIEKVTYPDGASVRYTYDRVGNRMTVVREGESPPTLIELSYFKARPTLKGIVIEWRTESEIDTAGFNLYRKIAREKAYEKITPTLIPAMGSPTAGETYFFIDVPPKRGRLWHFLLEEVETTGKTNKYGPVSTRNITLRSHKGTGAFKKSFKVKCD